MNTTPINSDQVIRDAIAIIEAHSSVAIVNVLVTVILLSHRVTTRAKSVQILMFRWPEMSRVNLGVPVKKLDAHAYEETAAHQSGSHLRKSHRSSESCKSYTTRCAFQIDIILNHKAKNYEEAIRTTASRSPKQFIGSQGSQPLIRLTRLRACTINPRFERGSV